MTEKEKELLELDILLYFHYKYNIPKNEYLDNEVYYPLYKSKKRYNLIWGGRGSGKSFDVEGKLPIVLISCLPFCRVLMVREIFASIKGSQYQEIIDYIDKWQLQSYFSVTKMPMRITHKESGNFIAFAGMDKPDSIKSVKDVTHVVFGEAFQIKSESGFDVVDKSVRTPVIDLTQIFITFNPDNKSHWLFSKFFDSGTESDNEFFRENMLSINTNHRHNKFLPYAFRQLIEKDKIGNPQRYRVDGLGQWGDLQSTASYYPNFDSEKQVVSGLKAKKYDANKDLHITLDFNVWPYISLEVMQVHDNFLTNELEVCSIDEICLNEKDNGADKVGKIEETIKEFLNRYKDHRGNVYVFGDRNGHNRKTNSVSDYATVFLMLQKTPLDKYITGKSERGVKSSINPFPEYEDLGCKFKVQDLTNRSNNPRHDARKLFFKRLHSGTMSVAALSRKTGTINAAGTKRPLSELHSGKRIVHYIDSKCRFLIADYINVQESDTGTKDERDKKLTHTSDAADYFFCMYFDAEFGMVDAELKR